MANACAEKENAMDSDVKPITDEERRAFLNADIQDIEDAAHFVPSWLQKYESALSAAEEENQQLRLAIIALAPEIENEIEQREACGNPDDEYVQRLVRPWNRLCNTLSKGKDDG